MNIQKRGDKWLVRVSRMVDGKQKMTGKRFRLKADAERWGREQETKIQRGEWVKPSKQSLDAFLDTWLAGVSGARRRTVEDYRRILATYVRPTLGETRLDQLSTTAIRSMLSDLTSQGYAPRTVRYVHAVLRAALNAAVEDGQLLVNPAVAKRMLPAMPRREQLVLSRDQARLLLDTTRTDPFGPLWNVLLLTGARPSEALALTWSDVDLGAKVMRIRRALVPQKRDADGKTWRLEDCKTSTSRRAIPLLSETVVALIQHRNRQAIERVIAGDRYAVHDFVFCDTLGQPLREDVLYKSHFRRALRAVGLPPVTL